MSGGGGGDQTLHSLPTNDGYGSSSQQPNLSPPVEGQLQLNTRDLEILNECQNESLTQRCAPMAAIAAGLTHFAVKSGRLNPHPRFGSLLKVTGGALVGFVFGKISYMPICREKFRADPHSAVGQKIREKEGGFVAEPPVAAPDSAYAPRIAPEDAGAPPAPSYADLRTRNRMNPGMPPVMRPPPSQPGPDDAGLPPEGAAASPPGGGYSYDYGRSNDSGELPPDQPSLLRKPRKKVNAYGDELEDV